MKKNIDFSILSTVIEDGDYCNRYVKLALETQFKDCYNILESIYYLGRWYATRKSLKAFFEVGDTTLRRKLDILLKLGLVEFYEVNTPNSYIRLTENGASLVVGKSIRSNGNQTNTFSLIEKSNMIYSIAINSTKYNPGLLGKFNDRDSTLASTFHSSIDISNLIKIDELERNHIYVVGCSTDSITLSVKHSHSSESVELFKRITKAYEFISQYVNIDNVEINIIVAASLDDKDVVEKSLSIIRNDNFTRLQRKELLCFFVDKHLGIAFEDFLDIICKSALLYY